MKKAEVEAKAEAEAEELARLNLKRRPVTIKEAFVKNQKLCKDNNISSLDFALASASSTHLASISSQHIKIGISH